MKILSSARYCHLLFRKNKVTTVITAVWIIALMGRCSFRREPGNLPCLTTNILQSSGIKAVGRLYNCILYMTKRYADIERMKETTEAELNKESKKDKKKKNNEED